MEGFHDLNSSEYLEESLTKNMIDQDFIFKKQVHDFHQLYAVQNSLMNLKNTRRELFPLKRMFTESCSVGSSRFILGDSFLQGDHDFCSRFQQRPLDLRLSCGNSCDDDAMDGEEVNLSLSIGRSTYNYKRSRITKQSWNDKTVHLSPRDIIDLEESTGPRSNEDARPVFYLDQSCQKLTDRVMPYSSQFLINRDHMKFDLSHRKRESSKNGEYEECSFFNQGSKTCHDLKKSTRVDLDLNKSQPDETSFHLNEPLELYPSSVGSYGGSCSRIGKPLEVSTPSIPPSKQPKSQNITKDIQPKACTIDLESLPEPSSDLTDENEIHISKVSEPKEKEDFDYTVQKAALSLISISLQQTSANNQSSETKSVSNEIENNHEIKNKKKTIPRSSSIDSYESLVLKLEESSVEEDSATSKAFEINESDQKDNGIKLRRGSRLKDFQKDILPIISSLSRHEIWEDINILEGVIRSREYKRLNKAKTGKGENRFKSARSKRSKVNYVGRRCCLRK